MWKNKRPIKAGLYFRNNPDTRYIIRQTIHSVMGILCVYDSTGNEIRLTDLDPDNKFWWYGPIPAPPYFYRKNISNAYSSVDSA